MIREYIYFVDDNPNGTSGMTKEEVVRCKDCKYYSSDGGALMICEVSEINTTETDFCSYGERSEEDNNG